VDPNRVERGVFKDGFTVLNEDASRYDVFKKFNTRIFDYYTFRHLVEVI